MYRLLEVTTNRHHFTYRFHLSCKRCVSLWEFFEVETWNLSNNVVNCRFERCRSRTASDIIFQFIKRVANSTFIITPYNVDIMGDLLDELENNGAFY